MKKTSTRHSQPPLPKLERLLLDADIDARLQRYLVAVGFDVVFAIRVDVDIHDDTEVLKWARRHRRIMLTHDRFRDGETKHKLYQEVYDNGGKIIQIGRRRNQSPLMLLGKILLHRRDWLEFFSDNEGMVLLHGSGMKTMPREYLIRQIQNVFVDTTPALSKPRRPRERPTPRHPPSEQGRLGLEA